MDASSRARHWSVSLTGEIVAQSVGFGITSALGPATIRVYTYSTPEMPIPETATTRVPNRIDVKLIARDAPFAREGALSFRLGASMVFHFLYNNSLGFLSQYKSWRGCEREAQ